MNAMTTRALLCCTLLVASAPATASEGQAHEDERTLPRGCGSCHRGHGARGSTMLPATGDEACLQCHGDEASRDKDRLAPDVAVRLRNLRGDFGKPFAHRSMPGGEHQRSENLPERDPSAPRHVSCLDCHDAHATRAVDPAGKRGLRPRSSTLRAHTFQYEVCYRCHGDSANLPARSRNIRRLFNGASTSFHPVEEPGRSGDVPSLRLPYATSSVLSCSDCHGGDDAASNNAPHGSIYAGLLVDNYITADGQLESDLAYRLCYRCHERNNILADETFSRHRRHLITPEATTSCFTCHNSHGSRSNPRLIEFNPMVVAPTSRGELRFKQTGKRQGECYLSCHNVEHAPGRYCPPEVNCDPGEVGKLDLQKSRRGQQQSPLLDQERSMFDDAPSPFGGAP